MRFGHTDAAVGKRILVRCNAPGALGTIHAPIRLTAVMLDYQDADNVGQYPVVDAVRESSDREPADITTSQDVPLRGFSDQSHRTFTISSRKSSPNPGNLDS